MKTTFFLACVMSGCIATSCYAASTPINAIMYPPKTLQCVNNNGQFSCTGYNQEYFTLRGGNEVPGTYTFFQGSGPWGASASPKGRNPEYPYVDNKNNLVWIAASYSISAYFGGTSHWVSPSGPHGDTASMCSASPRQYCPYTNFPFQKNKN